MRVIIFKDSILCFGIHSYAVELNATPEKERKKKEKLNGKAGCDLPNVLSVRSLFPSIRAL